MQEMLWKIAAVFSPGVRQAVENAARGERRSIQEIRLRANQPLSAVCQGRSYFLNAAGRLCGKAEGAEVVSKKEVEETFLQMCRHSLYAYEEQIAGGYLTLEGGCRVGLSGSLVQNGERLRGVRQISGLAVRIAGEKKGCAEPLLPFFLAGERVRGGVILSPPGGGKTTILRDLARLLSLSGRKVCLIDERGELAGCRDGIPQFDLGPFCDVIDGCSKERGLLWGLRSLSPQVLLLDELGGRAETEGILSCLHAGVPVILTLHASGLRDALQREQMKGLEESGAFETIAVLRGADAPGRISAIYQRKEGETDDCEDFGDRSSGQRSGCDWIPAGGAGAQPDAAGGGPDSICGGNEAGNFLQGASCPGTYPGSVAGMSGRGVGGLLR